MNQLEMDDLEESIDKMMEIAQGFGLDFYPMRFEVCPADIIYTFGAYGMPTRYSHWSFGKAFHRMKMEYDFGLSRIYELVINSDPCYAFLLDGNSLLQNKTVSAHVLAHCDFFKNNTAFSRTSRDMVERMASNAQRIRGYELEYGRKRVEALLDAGMAIQEHVDPSLHGSRGRTANQQSGRFPSGAGLQTEQGAFGGRAKASSYEDLWSMDEAVNQQKGSSSTSKPSGGVASRDEGRVKRKNPPFPQKDIMLFLIENSPTLEEWERDVLSLLREEMLYFWPQIETKIMNEGWASFRKCA